MKDDILEKVTLWLQTCPLWGERLTVDYTDGLPGSVGLFPLGVEEVSRREDVLGGVTARCRCRFAIRRVTEGQQDNRENARWLLTFQDWVRQQSLAGLTPAFGHEPAREQIRAEKGRLENAAQTGTGVYTVELIAEYVLQGEKQNGKN